MFDSKNSTKPKRINRFSHNNKMNLSNNISKIHFLDDVSLDKSIINERI